MKALSHSAKFNFAVTLAAALGIAQAAAVAATFSVTPSAVSNTYNGSITLNIGGLTNGEPVVIQKYIDANRNGIVDSGEPLVDSFRIMDGGAFVIGGITNINVPFDSDPAPGTIATSFSIAPPRSLANLVGQFVLSVSSPFGNFSPVTSTLTITNSAFGQSVSGVVYNGATPMPYAVVVVLALWPGEDEGRWTTGIVADNAGRYQVNLAPGSYFILPAFPGCYTDFALTGQVTLTTGMSATNDLFLANATATISGKVINAGNSNGVSGLMMPVESDQFLAITFTDSTGNYTAGIAPGVWEVGVDTDMVMTRAFVVPQNSTIVNTTTGSVAGVDVALWKANALLFGRITNSTGAPLPNIGFNASDEFGQYEASGITFPNGRFCVGILGGPFNWYCSPDTFDPQLAGYILSQTSFTNVNVGQALPLNISAVSATARIAGRVQDNLGQPVVGIRIMSSATIGGLAYTAMADTDSSGNYSLNAAPGTWNVFAECCGENGLQQFGLTDPVMHSVSIPPTNAVVDLTLYTYGTPWLFSPGVGGSTFAFQLNGAPGATYTIQTSTNLGSTNWTTLLVTNLPGNYLPLQDQITGQKRFYRVLLTP